MDKKILLNNKKSKRSVNVDNFINLKLSTTERILPTDNIINNINSYDVYNDEKDESNKYRLIFTINPICTNILFNSVTEIIYKEGSEDIEIVPKRENVITSKCNYSGKVITNSLIKYSNKKPKSNEDLYTTQAIRDTEYSHKDIGPYTYHCGYDIFNNHMLRNNAFDLILNKSISGLPSSISDDLYLYIYDNNSATVDNQIIKKSNSKYFKDTFNTIRDYARDSNGVEVRDSYLHLINQETAPKDRIIHTYQYDDIMSFNESVSNNLIEENGWFGFTNPSNIDVYNYDDISINKCMNNNKSCEHIDMYPDRSLYTFVPNVNKYRNNRKEYNWDICLTYPFSSTTNVRDITIDDNDVKIVEKDYFLIKENNVNALLITDYNIVNSSINYELVYLKTPIKHNLKAGDKITLYFKVNDVYNKFPYTIPVIDIGDSSYNDTKHWFSISTNDCEDIINYLNNDAITLRFAKNINGFDCKYYLRLFKKIPNFKFSKENIYDNSFIMTDDYINKYNTDGFNYSLNKLSFAQNIYSDYQSQIIFTDDIDLTKIKDNLNRPISEIFLTIIKRNKGYKNWYEYNIYNTSNIEYSHAFGKITSGFDFDKNSYNSDDYFANIHYQNNININGNYGCYDNTPDILKIPKSAISLENVTNNIITNENNKNIYQEDGITINGGYDKNVFIGDLVEFSPSEVNEIVIEDVFHRFNTAQREVTNPLYCDIIYDEIGRDDYDISMEPNETKNLIVVQNYLNKNVNDNDPTFDGNLFPEGYIYKPHYKIKIKEYDDLVNQGSDIQINYELVNYNKKSFKIKTAINYYIDKTDKLYLMNKNNPDKIINCTILNVDSLLSIRFYADEEIENIKDFLLFKSNPEKPDSAYLLKDKTGRYLWKNILSNKEIPYQSDLYNTVFTNGAHYLHDNINFFLRRQDPFNEYELYSVNSPISDLIISGNKKDISEFNYINENDNVTC